MVSKYSFSGHEMTSNTNLNSARNVKNDEFYTQMGDIENELRHYKDHFRDKVVYCNCDHPRKSNFVKYFRVNFQSLGLKKLIASCYRNNQPDLFSEYHWKPAIWMEYKGKQMDIKSLRENGDFRSAECIELLKQADIVVTNPPFSLFIQYVLQLMKYEKKFLIVGNMNALTYKEIFSLIKENKIWLGYRSSGSIEFEIPDDYPFRSTTCRIDENGRRFVGVVICWLTNLSHNKQNEQLILSKTYSPQEYPRYDNYDAIEVSRVKDIPKDWTGYMGVPITFLDKYNPDQFEIIGGWNNGYLARELGVRKVFVDCATKTRRNGPVVGKKALYFRILIRNKHPRPK